MTNINVRDEDTTTESYIYLRGCLLFPRRLVWFWTRSVQDLEEVAGLGSHSCVDVGLGALDVVMQVVPEYVNEVYGVVSGRLTSVSRK